jgi:anti-sigma factor RsiW
MCPEFEERLLCHDELASIERVAVDQHVAHCEECRSFLSALDQVDTALTAALSTRGASPAFVRTVWQDLARQARMRRPSMIPEMLDGLGWASIIAVLLGLAAFFVPGLDFSNTLAIVIGTMLLTGGLWIGGRCYGDLGRS